VTLCEASPALGLRPDDQLIAETTLEDCCVRRRRCRSRSTARSELRIDEAEADLAKVLNRRSAKKTAR
jgi:hypothetical protein